MHGFYRIAATSPPQSLANVATNVATLTDFARRAADAHAQVVVYPELCLTGYSCADLFFQDSLLRQTEAGLAAFAAATADDRMIHVVGLPVRLQSRLYNCAAVIQNGLVHGLVPKTHLPTYREFYEARWFTPGGAAAPATARVDGREVPFGTDLLFRVDEDLVLGVEICEDLWSVEPPSGRLALAGATVIANPSASNELVAKADYRRQLVASQSARTITAYAYASAGVGESTTDLVYGGHLLLAENGALLAEGVRFDATGQLICSDVDCRRLHHARISESSFGTTPSRHCREVQLAAPPPLTRISRRYPRHPFVPADPTTRTARCHEIFAIQTAGLARRLAHVGGARPVIGVSGGLDSTLALLVTHRACLQLGWDPKRILALTMPGFGTTARTRNNAVNLCQRLGVELREINIAAACEQHFRDIDHDPDDHSVTYENVQARERTQLLMDLANKHGGIVVGTGDLSEIALGWSTYNGDHMSMYAVNASVPKTLVQFVIRQVAEDDDDPVVRDLLLDVLDTPISPELTPLGEDGQLLQHTEKTVGPYELHDFFLYHVVKYGAEPEKILILAEIAFADEYSTTELKQWLQVFYRRFCSQQFKRSCMPDGPKVGTISLSPRGDWRMPSDTNAAIWNFPTDDVNQEDTQGDEQ